MVVGKSDAGIDNRRMVVFCFKLANNAGSMFAVPRLKKLQTIGQVICAGANGLKRIERVDERARPKGRTVVETVVIAT